MLHVWHGRLWDILIYEKGDQNKSGWWFGCHFWHFPINIGLLSSSQLTNSYFSGRGGPGPPTRNDEIFWLNHRELTRFIGIFWGPRNLCGPSVFDISTWCPGCQTIRYETRVRSLRSTREETLSGLKWDENILSIPINFTSDVLILGLISPENHGGHVTSRLVHLFACRAARKWGHDSCGSH